MKSTSNSDQSAEVSPTPTEVYEFHGFRLDAVERTLVKDGQSIALTLKALDTLIVLVRRHGRIVSRQELLEAVWPKTFVEPGILAQNILTLRKTLRTEWIETVPHRGYRFTAKVSAARAPVETPRSRTWIRWVVASGAILLAAGAFFAAERRARRETPVRSLAVLPFHSIPDASSYLELGLADVLINRLGTLHQIVVRPASAVHKFTDLAADPVAEGRELGVDAVLEGTVQRDGERVRTTVRLLRVPDGATLWTDQVDLPRQDLFALEDSIALHVANSLMIDLTAGERERLIRRYTQNSEAWHAYLRGRYEWNRRTPEAHAKAIEQFDQATRLDPNYALAYAGLADAYALLGSSPNRVMARPEAMAKARAAALRAIDLDPNLAEAHTSLGFILMHYDWKWADAEQEFKRALELNPSYATAHQWRAWNLLESGRIDDAIRELKTAQELDPASLIIMADLAELYFYLGRIGESEAQSRRVLELDPSFSLARCWLAWSLTRQSRFDEAASLIDNASWAGDDPLRLAVRVYLYVSSGHKSAALATARQLADLARRDFGLAFMVAIAYASMGDVDRMLPWLEQALSERNLVLLDVHPMFDPVRGDARFRAFVAEAGFPGRPQ